jgi:hypothetical protein
MHRGGPMADDLHEGSDIEASGRTAVHEPGALPRD